MGINLPQKHLVLLLKSESWPVEKYSFLEQPLIRKTGQKRSSLSEGLIS